MNLGGNTNILSIIQTLSLSSLSSSPISFSPSFSSSRLSPLHVHIAKTSLLQPQPHMMSQFECPKEKSENLWS